MTTYCALISACAKGDNNAEKTSQLLVEMLWKGLEPNLITHNVPISACAKGVHVEKALQLWRRCSGWALSRV